MRLYNLNKTITDDRIKVSISIDSKELGNKELWFSTDLKYVNSVCESQYDSYLVGLLYPAMKYDEDIHIEGKVSKKLLFNVNNYVIPLIKSFSPKCKQIRVTANEVISENLNGKGVGTGFSGGIDSFCTIYDHYEKEEDPEYKINSFVFLNVGAHGSKNHEKIKTKFETLYDYLKRYPEELGLDFIPVDSNLYEFHPWGHQRTHTLTSVSGIMFLQKSYNRYYYASAGLDFETVISSASNYKDIDIGAYSDAILLPLLSTESLELIPDGNQYTRTEKTLRIMNYEPVKRYLNVCVSGDDTHENCSICSKCSRTLMTLNSAGKLKEFNHLFDIDKYKNEAEKTYVCKQVAIQNKDPFAKGNVDLAKENNIKLPNRLICYLTLGIIKIKQNINVYLKTILSEKTVQKIRDRVRNDKI